MRSTACPLHDPGNHRSLERRSGRQAAPPWPHDKTGQTRRRPGATTRSYTTTGGHDPLLNRLRARLRVGVHAGKGGSRILRVCVADLVVEFAGLLD
jgi:hypothetical protein